MEANDLIKKSISIKDIYKQIEYLNDNNQYKMFYPHFMFIDDETKVRLINDGFKIYIGEWSKDHKGLIIEW